MMMSWRGEYEPGKSGCLPGSALLHLRKLSIFGMISRLPNNILHRHAVNIFSQTTISNKSWFHQIRDLCLKYNLPHPSEILKADHSKEQFKKLVKTKVVEFWQTQLREEAKPLPSLNFFSPNL